MPSKLTIYNVRKFKDMVIQLKESRLQKVTRLILTEKPGVMLDIGCGGGEFSSIFIKFGWIPYGVDIVNEQVKIATTRGVNAISVTMFQVVPSHSKTTDSTLYLLER